MNRGPIHDYLLGMDFDFSGNSNVKISMIKYLNKIFESFPVEIGKPCENPTVKYLFKTHGDEKKTARGTGTGIS